MGKGDLSSRYNELPPLHRKIYDLLTSENLTVATFAAKIGVSQQVLSRQFRPREDGEYWNISSSVKSAIRKTYGFTSDWFITDMSEVIPSETPVIDNKLDRLKMAINVIVSSGRASNPCDVADAMNVSRPTMSFVLNEKVALSDDFIIRFCTTYNNMINPEWIITGEGNMINNEEHPKVVDESAKTKEYRARIAQLEEMLSDAAIEIIKLNKELRHLRDGNR